MRRGERVIGRRVEGRRGRAGERGGGTYTHAEGAAEVAEGYPGAGVARVIHCCGEG